MRTLTILAATLLLPAMASQAHASVESMAEPRDGDRNCASAQENNRFAIWRPSNGRLVIGGEGKAKFEFYGHGIDTSSNAELTGISGGSARRVDGRGGGVNGARGCGNIGSIIVEIDLPAVGSANNGTLRIGSETIAFTATPRVAQNAEWDDANKADGRASGTPGTSTAPPPPPPPTSINNGGTCTGPGCPGPGNSVQAPTSGGTTGTSADTRTLPKCADPHGMKGEITNAGRDLTLTLPLVRTGAIEPCYSRHLLTSFQTKGVNDATTLSGPSPTLAMTATNRLDASFRQQDNRKDKNGLITLDADLLKTFVGRQSFDIDITPGSSTSRLKLILKSEPAYGPKTIAAPVVNPNIGRIGSDLALKVTTYQAAGTGEAFAWKVTPVDGAPSNCFSQTSGTITAPAGATTFNIPLHATEAAGCNGKSFKTTIATASVAAQATGTPFEQSATFVLQPVTTLLVPNQGRELPVNRPRL